MDNIPDDLLKLKVRFDQWRANRKTRSEPIPDELRCEALEMTKRFSSTLLLKVLKVQVWHLKNIFRRHYLLNLRERSLRCLKSLMRSIEADREVASVGTEAIGASADRKDREGV